MEISVGEFFQSVSLNKNTAVRYRSWPIASLLHRFMGWIFRRLSIYTRVPRREGFQCCVPEPEIEPGTPEKTPVCYPLGYHFSS